MVLFIDRTWEKKNILTPNRLLLWGNYFNGEMANPHIKWLKSQWELIKIHL
jgi:hypothetical protein